MQMFISGISSLLWQTVSQDHKKEKKPKILIIMFY